MENEPMENNNDTNQEENNRNNNNNLIVFDSLIYERIFDNHNIIKTILLLFFICFICFIGGSNNFYNIDKKIYNFNKNFEIKEYYNNFIKTISNLFMRNNNKLNFIDDYNIIEEKPNLEINFNDFENIEEKKLNKITRNLNSENFISIKKNLQEKNITYEELNNYHNFSNENNSNNNILDLAVSNSSLIKKFNLTNNNHTDEIEKLNNLNSDFPKNSVEILNNNDKELKNNDYKLGEVYYFMNNITLYDYSGRWKGSNPNDMFEKKEGGMMMEIRKNQSHKVFNLISNIEYFRILEFTYSVKDGDYRDNWMIFNFTMKFPKNFSKNFIHNEDNINLYNISSSPKINKNKVILIEENVEIKYFIGELFEIKNITQCNRSRVELEFIKDEIFKIDSFDNVNSIQFSKINGKINDLECDFNFEFSLKIDLEDVNKNFIKFRIFLVEYGIIH